MSESASRQASWPYSISQRSSPRESHPKDQSRDDADRPDEWRERRHRSESSRDVKSQGRYRDGYRDRYRDRSDGHDRYRDRYDRHDGARGSGSRERRSRDRSRSRDRHRDRDRDRGRDREDRYRGRDRSQDRSRDRHRDPDGPNGKDNRRGNEADRQDKDEQPELSEIERDRRTVFVSQLAARLRTRELIDFFERAGAVTEASIVKDRHNRSKGVAYVEFVDLEAVPRAIRMTNQKLLGIPVMVQYTESERIRQAMAGGLSVTDSAAAAASDEPTYKLYVGNINFDIGEEELRSNFGQFGRIVSINMPRNAYDGRFQGFAFILYDNPSSVELAIAKMAGAMIGGRTIRVGHGKNESDTTRPDGSGATNSLRNGEGTSSDDRASHEALMQRLLRDDNGDSNEAVSDQVPAPALDQPPSRCLVLSNMFDASEETGENWVEELEDDVKAECEERYGRLIHISVDRSSEGDIYAMFEKLESAMEAVKRLDHRYFGGREITVSPIVELAYKLRFPKVL